MRVGEILDRLLDLSNALTDVAEWAVKATFAAGWFAGLYLMTLDLVRMLWKK